MCGPESLEKLACRPRAISSASFDHTELFDGGESFARASAATPEGHFWLTEGRFFSRFLVIVMLRLWSAKPGRKACLTSKRE